MGQNAKKSCHCEPVTDVTGVAISRIEVKSLIFNRRCLKIRGIATPACALVRNDIFLFGHFVILRQPLAVLYNASVTMGSYYSALVQHDLAGSG